MLHKEIDFGVGGQRLRGTFDLTRSDLLPVVLSLHGQAPRTGFAPDISPSAYASAA